MITDSRKRRKTPSSCGNPDTKDEQPVAKIQCRSPSKSTQNESIDRQKERLILARASVVKVRLLSLNLKEWKLPGKIPFIGASL